MPRRQKAVQSETKRLFLYAGNSVSDEIVHKLGILYAVESPTIARLESSPKSEIKKPNPGERYTRMRLVTILVRMLADRDALRVEAAKFYLKHIDYFSEEITDKRRLGLTVDPETYALCQSLPYSIVGSGSISLLYRVILYFFAVKNKIIDPPAVSRRVGTIEPVPLTMPKAVMPAALDRRNDPRIERVDQQVTLSMDPEGVWELDRLSGNFKRKKMSLFRAFIKAVASDEAKLEGVKKFYRQEFIRKEPMKGRTIIRLNASKQELALLDHIAYSVTGATNRSLTARCIVGYFIRSGDMRLE